MSGDGTGKLGGGLALSELGGASCKHRHHQHHHKCLAERQQRARAHTRRERALLPWSSIAREERSGFRATTQPSQARRREV